MLAAFSSKPKVQLTVITIMVPHRVGTGHVVVLPGEQSLAESEVRAVDSFFGCGYALFTNAMTKTIKRVLDLATSIAWTATQNSINKLVKLLIINVRHFRSGGCMYRVFVPIGVYHRLERCLSGFLESSTLLMAGYRPWMCAEEVSDPGS